SKRRLLFGCGKGRALYVLDQDKLGGYDRKTNRIVQFFPGLVGPCFSMGALFRDRIYLQPSGDPLKAFALEGEGIAKKRISEAPERSNFMGGTPSVSANRDADAIVWVFRLGPESSVTLHAFDAEDLSKELYNSAQAGRCDLAGPAVKFTLPTVANGKVYVGSA